MAAYIKFDGIDGESVDDKNVAEIDRVLNDPPSPKGEATDNAHKDWIIIESFSQDDSESRFDDTDIVHVATLLEETDPTAGSDLIADTGGDPEPIGLLLPAVQAAREAARGSTAAEDKGGSTIPGPSDTVKIPDLGPLPGPQRYDFEVFTGQTGDVPDHKHMVFEAELYEQTEAMPLPLIGNVAATSFGDGHQTIAFESSNGAEFDLVAATLGIWADETADMLQGNQFMLEIQGFRDGFEMPMEQDLVGFGDFQFENDDDWDHSATDMIVFNSDIENVDRVEITVISSADAEIDLAPVMDMLVVDFV